MELKRGKIKLCDERTGLNTDGPPGVPGGGVAGQLPAGQDTR